MHPLVGLGGGWGQNVTKRYLTYNGNKTPIKKRDDDSDTYSDNEMLMNSETWFSVALRPQRQVGLLGMGTEWEGGERVKGSTAETARKRPERPWTAARTMEVLRPCPLAIAQRLVHCAIALSTAVLDRVTKTMSVAPLLTNNLDNSKQKTSNLLSPAPPPYS